MPGYVPVSDEQFEAILKEGLGDNYARAVEVSHSCGKFLTLDIVNLLLWAIDKDKVQEVLDALMKHYHDHLMYQHPDIRGTVPDEWGYDPTKRFFVTIYTDTLGLTPNEATEQTT